MIIRGAAVGPLEFHGLEIYDYTARQPTSSSVAVVRVPPGAEHQEALSRRSDKYYFLMSGTLRVQLDGPDSELGVGDLWFIPRGQRFAYRNPGPESAALLLVHTPTFDLASEDFITADGEER